MNSSEILAQIEEEIKRLQEIKALLGGLSLDKPLKSGPRSKPSEQKAAKKRIATAKKQPWSSKRVSGRIRIKAPGTGDGGYDVQRGEIG